MRQSFIFVLLASMLTACVWLGCTPKPNKASQERPATTNELPAAVPVPSDTLYWQVRKRGTLTHALPDSLTQLYLSQSLQGKYYLPLSLELAYKGYDLGTYPLTAGLEGQLIQLEPEYNAYTAVYLFLKDSNQQPVSPAIEVAHALWEEGVQGQGRSFLLRQPSTSQLYTKQDWVYYHGSAAAEQVATDTLIGYNLTTTPIAPMSINAATAQAWRTLFATKR
jgi:hypothetical protein